MDKKTVNDRVIIALKYLMKLRPDLTKTMLSELLDITNFAPKKKDQHL
jgi:hypothetical protein